MWMPANRHLAAISRIFSLRIAFQMFSVIAFSRMGWSLGSCLGSSVMTKSSVASSTITKIGRKSAL